MEGRARPVVAGHLINALVVGHVKNIRRTDVLFDGNSTQLYLCRSVEAACQRNDLVAQLLVAFTSDTTEQRVLAAAGRVTDAAANHGVVPPVVDAVEGVVVSLQTLPDTLVPLVGRQEVPLDVPALFHRPQRSGRNGVLGLILIERGRNVVADQWLGSNGRTGLGDDVAGHGRAGRGWHGLPPLVDLFALLAVALARHLCPPVSRSVVAFVVDDTGLPLDSL